MLRSCIYVIVVIALSYRDSCAILLLAKTRETFKLSELQHIEARIQAEQNPHRYGATRLLVDQATGSSLFRIDLSHEENLENGKSHRPLQDAWLRRCDWVGEVVADGECAAAMVESLRRSNGISLTDGWVLDYTKMACHGKQDDKMQSPRPQQQPSYTMKTLLCSVAQAFPAPPCLHPDQAKDRFLILDTSTMTGNCCYLIRILDDSAPIAATQVKGQVGKDFTLKWAKRPFQYSSAINMAVAEIIIDTLHTLCQHNSAASSDSKPSLWDPTCGSGTFLAMALERHYRVEGCDRNLNAVKGTIDNLRYMFSDQVIGKEACITVQDSASCFWKQADTDLLFATDISCVVSNLPWGRNSVKYMEENEQIISVIRKRITVGTPCAFITRPTTSVIDDGLESMRQFFEQAGFEVLGQANVPPREFQLPKSEKMSKKKEIASSHESPADFESVIENDESHHAGRKQTHKDCLVTIAVAK
ncbi:hypothetical protein IV203_015698 [Nitzschia inconspicua]|uniref:Uncharacterized protein n=1 Tax=Nitzschia inconspicua TaxID=303405 RepID=A0A9K3LCC5_9STRA|nr:hypothetical protein IV203_015698 [Nitzschia inconspicua]